MAKITVVIVSWNVAGSLQACLASVAATRYPDTEIIVVDNASTDNSAKVARSAPGVTYIQNTSNLGFPKAVNIGLRQSRGDYILILNPDTRLPRNFFTSALDFFARHPDAWLMGPRLANPDGTPQGSVFPEPSILAAFREFWLGHQGLTQKFIPATHNLQPTIVNAVSGSCLFFPRSTLDRVGLFTEQVFMYYEDLDFCRRIRSRGGKIYFLPGLTVMHEHGRSARQSDSARTWRGHLWASSLWYNGPFKHYLMWLITRSGQKFRSVFH